MDATTSRSDESGFYEPSRVANNTMKFLRVQFFSYEYALTAGCLDFPFFSRRGHFSSADRSCTQKRTLIYVINMHYLDAIPGSDS